MGPGGQARHRGPGKMIEIAANGAANAGLGLAHFDH